MDAAYNAVSMSAGGGKHDMHSGGTLNLAVGRYISKRYFCVVFVFQEGRPTIIPVVIRLLRKLELGFGYMRGMLECRIQSSA